MKTLYHAGIVVAFCAGIAACAGPGASPETTAAAAPVRATTIAADNVNGAVTIGKSTKADVMAALGKTTVISFDSGYEVWVYHVKSDTPRKSSREERIGFARSEKAAPGKTEFVVLFAPSGFVTKTRIRAAPPPGEDKGT